MCEKLDSMEDVFKKKDDDFMNVLDGECFWVMVFNVEKREWDDVCVELENKFV